MIIVEPQDGECSSYIQNKIDKAFSEKKKLIFKCGTYLTAPIFLKSGLDVTFENVTLEATINEDLYPLINTRVAGIEMEWYPAILNIIDCKNVKISGSLIVNGNGPYWWNKYWGEDMKGGMRKNYDEAGLRAFCDYDCKRPRNILVANSQNILLNGITSTDSGFWNFHILYSKHVEINKCKVLSGNLHSPSTDGIDIDSSSYVKVKNCVTDCNDDSICIKSGRDSDGINIAKPCHDIEIKDCTINRGFGVTIGSEVSGGVYGIKIHGLKYYNTDCGFRIKSSFPRKGYIKDVRFYNNEMVNVSYLFHWYLNWNPNYSICELPNDYEGEIYSHYRKLITKTEGKNTDVSDILVKNIRAYNEPDYNGISRAFNIEGFSDSPIRNVKFDNVKAKTFEFGVMNYIDNIKFKDCEISASKCHDPKNDVYDNR